MKRSGVVSCVFSIYPSGIFIKYLHNIGWILKHVGGKVVRAPSAPIGIRTREPLNACRVTLAGVAHGVAHGYCLFSVVNLIVCLCFPYKLLAFNNAVSSVYASNSCMIVYL